MLKLITDEDFNNRILRGLLRRKPGLDIVRVQDTSLLGGNDSAILEWAFLEKRVILTHDVNTMTAFAYQRIQSGHPIAGLIVIHQSLPIGQAIHDILTIALCSTPTEFKNQIQFLPL